MNQKAKEIGMENTRFVEPIGSDREESKNVASAKDIAKLFHYAMKQPVLSEIMGTKYYRTKTQKGYAYVWVNQHKLIRRMDGVIGGKVGFSENARRTLVTVAQKGDQQLVVVTLNNPNDWRDHVRYIRYGYNTFKQ